MRCVAVVDDNHKYKAKLRAAIEKHIAARPLSGDTASGIVERWLPAVGYEEATSHIEAVLAEMVADDWLTPWPLPGGDILYIANLSRCSTSRPSS